jgi:hypothetical protein
VTRARPYQGALVLIQKTGLSGCCLGAQGTAKNLSRSWESSLRPAGLSSPRPAPLSPPRLAPAGPGAVLILSTFTHPLFGTPRSRLRAKVGLCPSPLSGWRHWLERFDEASVRHAPLKAPTRCKGHIGVPDSAFPRRRHFVIT